MENVRKHCTIKFANSTERRNYLVFKPNYYSTKCFFEKSLATEMRKKAKMNKPVYLMCSTLDLIKIQLYEFCYDYVSKI